MEFINPVMTIQNAKGPHWLVSFEHQFNGDERISLSVKVTKSGQSLAQVEKEAFDRATELIQIVSRSID